MRRILFLTLFWTALAFAADLKDVLQQLATYEYGQNPSSVRELDSAVQQAAGTPEAAAIEKQVIAAFNSAKTLAAKDALCRALAVVGTSASVPVLAGMLANADTAEMARYALEQIPGQAATAVLRTALRKSPAQSKAGVVVSLGRRKDTEAVQVLKPLLASSDQALANAAATALGNIGGNPARDALLAAKPSLPVNDALLAIAERSPGPSAVAIYRRLATAEYAESARMAALRGLARIDAKQSAPVLMAALKSDSPRLQAVAVRELASIEGVALAKRMPELSASAQVQLISALADAGRADVLPVLEQSLTSESGPVRVAALRGIAKLGSASQIPMLAERAASSTADEQGAARAALAGVRGEDADSAVLSAIPAAEPKVKVELIRAAGERGIPRAPEILLKTATETNRAVRAESIRALRETAGPAHVASLVSLLVKAEDENERKEYERTVAAAIRRSKEAAITEVAKAYQAAPDVELKSSLLAVMAAVGNNDALPVVREALSSSDADVQRAAVNALAAWPSPEPMKDLLTLAQSATNAAHQVLALRGYVRLVQIPSNRPPAETAKMLAAGMAAAKRPEEKKIVIAAAQRLITPESLELVKSTLGDPAVAAEAKAAVTALERGLTYRRN